MPLFLYRGDKRSPQEISLRGGFHPRGDYAAAGPEVFSIRRHKDGPMYWAANFASDLEHHEEGWQEIYQERLRQWTTAYVSTSKSADFARDRKDWVYKIRATPNLINVEDTLDEFDVEEEFVALGGILWSQVVGWISGDDFDSIAEDGPSELTDAQIELNSAFDSTLLAETYCPYVWQPLRGEACDNNAEQDENALVRAVRADDLPTSAKAFMDQFGAAVRWTGSFPLIARGTMPRVAKGS
ncbi:hypothetical protein HIM_07297 [Hirsutella minnesotensis 3608]|uniref:Enterotoxin n=1 Tax=Hirsutella minnesotensis 3608 TaxID=1043627 RepID=A0A0F7ZTK9_9HYPO|nr:hypothetical protein HIM_07297 [Hirsutella minnesotensis 3608]